VALHAAGLDVDGQIEAISFVLSFKRNSHGKMYLMTELAQALIRLEDCGQLERVQKEPIRCTRSSWSIKVGIRLTE
jgi:hypothetical protein